MSNFEPLATMTSEEIDEYISEFESEIVTLRQQRDDLLETCRDNDARIQRMNMQLDALLETHDDLVKLKAVTT